MSKILVLDDRQFQELKRIFESMMQNSFMPQDLEITSFYDSIQSAFECAEKENRSVLEWHDVKEAPSSKADRVFVEYSDGGFGFIFGHPEIVKDDPDYKRWAYLPGRDVIDEFLQSAPVVTRGDQRSVRQPKQE